MKDKLYYQVLKTLKNNKVMQCNPCLKETDEYSLLLTTYEKKKLFLDKICVTCFEDHHP